MNVLMVIERYQPIWGGAENQLKQLLPYLQQKSCNVKVATRRWYKDLSKKETIDGIEVIRLGVPGTNLLATILFVISLMAFVALNSRRIDILHSHGAVNLGALGAICSKIFKLKNVAKIATAGKIPELQNKTWGRLILFFFKKSTAIIAMTDEIKDELKATKTPRQRIFNIPNGVDVNRFRPGTQKEREKWRADQGISYESQILMFSGRLVYRKGLDILLDAWAEIIKTYPHAILLVLGSGTNQLDSIEKKMKKLIVNNDFINICFLGESDNPETILKMCDIFIFPSRAEGMPNSLMEAMSSGVPVVASDIGGVRPLVKHGVTGLLFASERSTDLLEKVNAILSNHTLRIELAKNARSAMLENYSFRKISSKYFRLYRSILHEDDNINIFNYESAES